MPTPSLAEMEIKMMEVDLEIKRKHIELDTKMMEADLEIKRQQVATCRRSNGAGAVVRPQSFKRQSLRLFWSYEPLLDLCLLHNS